MLDDAEIGVDRGQRLLPHRGRARRDWWAADAVTETLDRTSLGVLRDGDAVNLERPVRLADRLGGHIVQGHVGAVGTIVGKHPIADGSVHVVVSAPQDVLRYVVEKGSITVTASASPWPRSPKTASASR